MGLVDKLKKASTEKDVNNLLMEGKKYTMASTRTKSKWLNVCKRKLAEIESANNKSDAKQETSDTKSVAPEVTKKKPYRKIKRS